MNDAGEVLLTLYEAIDSVAQVGHPWRGGSRGAAWQQMDVHAWGA